MVLRPPRVPLLAVAPLLVAGLLVSETASAQQVQQPSRGERYRMTLSMEDYFEGERAAGYAFLGEGLVSIGTSAFLFTRGDDMSKGAAYPVAVIGALEAVVGLALSIRTSGQIAERKQWIANDPVAFQQNERKRMERVIKQFVFLEVFELTAMVAGLGMATYGELGKKPLVTGIGAGLTVQAAALLGLDFLAERRGQRYLNAIVDFNPSAARGSTFGLGWGGTF